MKGWFRWAVRLTKPSNWNKEKERTIALSWLWKENCLWGVFWTCDVMDLIVTASKPSSTSQIHCALSLRATTSWYLQIPEDAHNIYWLSCCVSVLAFYLVLLDNSPQIETSVIAYWPLCYSKPVWCLVFHRIPMEKFWRMSELLSSMHPGVFKFQKSPWLCFKAVW